MSDIHYYEKLYLFIEYTRKEVEERFKTVHTPVKEASLKEHQPLPIFSSSVQQWNASVRFYFLEYFGLNLDDGTPDNSLKWWSLCKQQLAAI